MRAAPFATIVGLTLGLLSQTVFAREPLKVNSSAPANYDAVQKDVDTIEPYLEASQCGGWKDDTVDGKIATISGLPGRNGIWDGAILTGMATRKDENGDGDSDKDFVFPPTAEGLTTVCSPDKTEIGKKVWKRKDNGRPDEIEQVDKTFPHPKFTDPSCTWRRKNPDGSFESIAPGFPLDELQNYDPPPDYGELDQEPDNRQSPENCLTFCKMLNDYQYEDCLEVLDLPDPGEDVNGNGTLDQGEDVNGNGTLDPGDPNVTYKACRPDQWGNKYLCSDQKVTDANAACETNTGDMANSRQCVGAECRCAEAANQQPGNGCVDNPGTKQDESSVYYSYYRSYEAKYERDHVDTDAGRDVDTDTAEVACYGFYDEFDPKFKRTEDKDRRCVINIDISGRRDSQTGKGEYGQNTIPNERDPNDPANQRSPGGANRNAGDYDQDKDLWYLKLGGGFSLLNEKVFSGSYDKDLTKVFLNVSALDTGTMRATEQAHVRQPFAKGNNIRSFDDTGERNIVSWWQTQQNAIAAILHPPIIRMILPSGFAMNIDPDDPFFRETKAKILKPLDKRDDRIEVQINAEDDTLGGALSYLQRSMILHVREEPVPAIIPVGTATEFRSKAEAWCIWYMIRAGKQNCEDAPPEVATLIRTLESYATDIEKFRLLRAELPKYAAKILALQQNATKPVSEWMVENIGKYKNYLADQKTIQDALSQEWKEAQEAYETFGSSTNLPWCMNQRFTMPVYSLLDDWLPARETNGERSANGLPLLSVDSHADIVLDLSAVAFMSGSITLPVLDPIQVRVTDFPSPPSPTDTKPIPTYPPLPDINAIQDAFTRSANGLPKPNDNPPNIPPITLKPIDTDAADAQANAIVAIRDVIKAMDERYKKFWNAIGPFKPYDPEHPEPDLDPDPNNTKTIVYKKPRRECEAWNDNTCQFVEMNLREELMRIASRPLVFLNEDYLSKDEERGIGGPCIGQLDVCSPVHPEEGGEKHIWEIKGPKTSPDTVDQLRKDVRDATLPAPVGAMAPDAFPRYGTPTDTLLPSTDVPRPIDLFLPRSSSSASSQP